MLQLYEAYFTESVRFDGQLQYLTPDSVAVYLRNMKGS